MPKYEIVSRLAGWRDWSTRLVGLLKGNRPVGARLRAAILVLACTLYATPLLAQSPPSTSSSFSPSTILVNQTTSLTFTITNPNVGVTLTGVGFTDSLPAGVTVSSASATVCGGTVTTTSPGSISLSGATISASAQCQFSVTVTGATAGTKINSTSAVSSNEGGNGNSSTATLTVNSPSAPSIATSFSPSTIATNQTTSLTFTITNPNAGSSLTGVGFTDSLPAGVTVSSASATVCGGTVTTTSPGSISLSGATISASAQCQFSVTVTGATAGTKSNSTSAVTSNEGGNGNSSTAILTVNSPSAPSIATSFSPSTIAINQTSSLTFTITNPNASSSLTGVGFTDSLPAGVTVFNASASVCGGTVTLTAPGSISLSGATIAANSQCQFSVTVTGATAGTKINSTGAVASNEGGSGSGSTATLIVGTGATTTSLVSSRNPSSFGEPVTFTASVSGAGATGTVTFKDGANVLGTSTLNGSSVATFAISTLAVGSHSITATYGGDATFAGSASSPLAQLVNVPADSLKLRALQIAVTKIEAQSSGSAVSGAIDAAIGDGFAGGGAPVSASDNGFHFNLMAEQEGTNNVTRARVGDAFASLDRDRISKAPALIEPPKQWLAWVDVRGTGWNTNVQTGDIRGGQVNALLGLTRKVTPDLLVGVFGGYENFDYSSQLLDGRLKGDGWTLGGYLGWKFLPGLRFDAGLARAGVSYDGIAGTAAATFPGQRWIASASLVGLYKTAPGFEIEPSARVFAVWEHENAYTDSLGITQAERRFSNGRASTGAKVTYPWVVDPSMTLTPYVGLYADYYFNSDDATLPLAPMLLPTQFLHGWSSRLTSGLGMTTAGGAKISIGGELGGLGSDQFTVWSARGRASVPF